MGSSAIRSEVRDVGSSQATRWRRGRREWTRFYLFISPWLIGLIVFTGGPLLFSLYAGFTRWNGVGVPSWVGLQNFDEMVTIDPDFFPTIGRTLYYAAASVVLGVVLALGLALMVNVRLPGRTLFRTIFYVPTVVTGIPVFIVWAWMFSGNNGIINYLLGFLHIPGPPWLASDTWAMPALIVVSLTSTGGAMVIFLAGLQGIPRELYEAATVDGARRLRRIWHVTVPMLSPIILLNAVLSMIFAMQAFAQPYVMTNQGGPDKATYIFGLYIYQYAFEYLNFGYASALSWVLLLIILILTLLLFLVARGRVYYAGEVRR